MERCHWAVAAIAALVLFSSAGSSPAAEKPARPGENTVADSKTGGGAEAVFEMKEVSLFDQKDRPAIAQFPIFGGQNASLRAEPAKEVKAYPKLNSKQPLYGSIVFDRAPGKPGPAAKFHFVLDESGTAEGVNEKTTKPDPAKPTAGNRPKNHYDRLYFDVDRDLDLTNDAAVSPMQDVPSGLAQLLNGPQATIVFNTVSIPLGDSPKAKGQAVSVLPVIVLYGSTYDGNAGRMVLLQAAARKGEIRLGNRAYTALLVPQNGLIGRMNLPNTQLILTPVDGPKPVGSYPGMDALGAIRQSDGEFYRISATPSGDRLTVCPVGGERGTFELSAGDKHIKPLGVVGVLALKESASQESMLPLGEMGYPVQPQRAQTATYRLPVGDYRPVLLTVDCGDLRMNLRADYTLSSGGPPKQADRIEIRKDKPYVLDFATKPEVHILAPPAGGTFKPGDEIHLAAVLRITGNGLMVCGMEDMGKKTGTMAWTAEDGRPMTSPSYASLAPTVVIADSSGKKVAEGTMPFG